MKSSYKSGFTLVEVLVSILLTGLAFMLFLQALNTGKNVRVKSENSQMKGGFAVIDTAKGVSTLYPNAVESGYSRPGDKPRVSAVLVPKPKRVKNLIDSD